MTKKYRNRAQENSRVIRIPLTTYIELRQLAIEAQVSIGVKVEALAKLEAARTAVRRRVRDNAKGTI